MTMLRPLSLMLVSLLGLSGPAHGEMAITVTANKVLIGSEGEFMPTFTNLPRVLVVGEGETVMPPADSVWDTVLVRGVLTFSRERDTLMRFIHLIVLPGGWLDVGTVEDPILTNVALFVRDVPIDLTKDPFQWGNGIVNFGKQTRVGRHMEKAWTELLADAPKAARQIRIAVPGGWQVGHELVLPDMRQMMVRPPAASTPRREARVFITAIDGDVVTLSKPLDFDHLSVLDPDGNIVLRPRVANVTRSIVIGSENPTGTRGHTANVGEFAEYDIRYNLLADLGRTTTDNLSSAVINPDGTVTPGTQQVGRYAAHDHHIHGGTPESPSHPHTSHFIGNAILDNDRARWGYAAHQSSDLHIEENIAVGFVGAGFVTEDGPEVRNVFRRNVAAYSKGNGLSALGQFNRRDSPGGEGSGFWLRGVHQIVEENEAWNNVVGFTQFMLHQVVGPLVPGVPGGHPDTPFDPRTAVPVSWKNNKAIGNRKTGLEMWGVPDFPNEGQVSAHNGQHQVFAGASRGIVVHLKDSILLARGGITTCVQSSEAYVSALKAEGGMWVGCQDGTIRGGGAALVDLRNLLMQNKRNVYYPTSKARQILLENVVHRQLLTFPKQFVVLGDKRDKSTTPGDFEAFHPQRGARIKVINWQGSGQDYLLFENEQKYSKPAWKAHPAPNACRFCSPAPMTMGESWLNLGLAYRGSAVDDADAVELEGLIDAVARPGLADPLGVPKAILTLPNMMEPAVVNQGTVRLNILLTGDYTVANQYAVVQIDGGAPIRRLRRLGQLEDERSFDTTVVSPGTHTVKTWREDVAGRKIAASEMTFQYFVQ